MEPSIIALLKDPRMSEAEFLLLQSGKPPYAVKDKKGKPLSNLAVAAAQIQKIFLEIIPASMKATLVSQPTASCRLHFAGFGMVELTVIKTNSATQVLLKPFADESPASEQPIVSESQAEDITPSAPEIEKFFAIQLAMKASDMHLSSGVLPMVRKDGEMTIMEGITAALSSSDLERILLDMMPEKNRQEFQAKHDTDFAYELRDAARFRCNVFLDRKGIGGVFRVIPQRFPTAEELGLTPEILKLCYLTKGLVLVTGPTGSGKSTTLCSMIDYINQQRKDHIITIEDPIEFVHENKGCLVNQREVFNHTDSFKNALRAALREDPDIMLVGEMRDLETISIAIETAETGHLVFGTLHTNTAPSTVDRIIDQFPADRQSQIRVMLSESLKAVISQTLCRKIGGGRVAAMEVLIVDHAVANLIREGKTMQIPSAMQTGKAKGNMTLNDSLISLVKRKLVEPREAYLKAVDKAGFESMLNREGLDTAFLKHIGASAEKPASAAAATPARSGGGGAPPTKSLVHS
jgi:twitching motility protein PilT